MRSIKISLNNCVETEFFEPNTLDDLIEKVEKHFGLKIEKLVRSNDWAEVTDDEIFQFILSSPGQRKHLIAIQQQELDTKIIEENNKKLRKKLENLDQNVNELESLIEAEENSNEIASNKVAFNKLEKRYYKMVHETTTTKLTNTSEIKILEHRISNLNNQISNMHILISKLITSDAIDFCFLIDCTSSMSSYINHVHTCVEHVLKKTQNINGTIRIRFSYVGYRDFSELDQRIISIPFIEDVNLFKQLLDEIETFGGEDECEDVFGGLSCCAELDWSSPVRILFHLCDAPCHGRRFHANLQDFYPDGDPLGSNIKDLLTNLSKLNVGYYFAELNKSTLKMIEEFNKELPDYKVKSLKLNKISDLICQTIQESILRTIVTKNTVMVPRIKQLDSEIDWNDLKKFKKFNVDYYTSNYLKDFRDSRIDFSVHPSKLLISNKPFSHGALRYAYPCLHLDEFSLKCILKESVFTNTEFNTKKYHEECVLVQSIAKLLAYKFGKLDKDFKIRFLSVDLVRLHETGVYYTLEEFVEGDFIKWMNNEGKWNSDAIDLLSAFSHWTYDATNGYLMITDLQGFVYKNREFTLTDPAVLSANNLDSFGKANLGFNGLKSFFENHKCNTICKKLNLKVPSNFV